MARKDRTPSGNRAPTPSQHGRNNGVVPVVIREAHEAHEALMQERRDNRVVQVTRLRQPPAPELTTQSYAYEQLGEMIQQYDTDVLRVDTHADWDQSTDQLRFGWELAIGRGQIRNSGIESVIQNALGDRSDLPVATRLRIMADLLEGRHAQARAAALPTTVPFGETETGQIRWSNILTSGDTVLINSREFSNVIPEPPVPPVLPRERLPVRVGTRNMDI